jgi:hypothetical protein
MAQGRAPTEREGPFSVFGAFATCWQAHLEDCITTWTRSPLWCPTKTVFLIERRN